MASFRKRGNKWQYRISYIDPLTQKRKEVSKGGFNTQKEAKHAAAIHEQQLLTGHGIVDKDTYLKDHMYSWLKDYKKNNVKLNTYKLHEQNIRVYIVPYFKNIKVSQVTPLNYQGFLNYLAEEKKFSKRTIEIVHDTMSQAMRIAVKPLKMINENPCDDVTIPKVSDNKKEGLKYIASDEIPAFLKNARQDNYIYYIYFKTLINTGMRKGEAAALQTKDVDLENGYINISKSLDFQADNDESLFGDTKTFDSKRVIKIDDSLNKELKKHMEYLEEKREIFEDIYRYDLDLIFCREDGNFSPNSTLFNAFNRILKKTGIEKLPIHSTRHTHAVLLLESGASMKFVQERLGHKSISITSDIYSHISTKIEDESIDQYEKYINSLNKV